MSQRYVEGIGMSLECIEGNRCSGVETKSPRIVAGLLSLLKTTPGVRGASAAAATLTGVLTHQVTVGDAIRPANFDRQTAVAGLDG